MRYVILLLLCWVLPVHALTDAGMLHRALPYLPTLKAEIARAWPQHPAPATAAAQVEQESLWNPNAHLHTAREEGYGLAQFTVTPRFNAINETKALDPSLRGWVNPYDVPMQLRALVAKDLQCYRLAPPSRTPQDHLAFTYAAYNGGNGGVMSDRRVCLATKGCDPRAWTGNVELTSLKAKTAVSGYGQSFFQINRAYVRNILVVRPVKYASFFKD